MGWHHGAHHAHGPHGTRYVSVIRGDYRVSADQHDVFTTVLGSCLATCLHDPERHIGGMNHFNLPGVWARTSCDEVNRYGVHLMELLINALLQRGARRERLEAKLLGGATIVRGLSDIGRANALFARQYLENEGIRVVGARLGGDRGMRIEYRPTTGGVRHLFLDKPPEADAPAVTPARFGPVGEVELF